MSSAPLPLAATPSWMNDAPGYYFAGYGNDTQVCMFDGSSRPMSSLNVGDCLLGPDGHPRFVFAVVQRPANLTTITFNEHANYLPLTMTENAAISVLIKPDPMANSLAPTFDRVQFCELARMSPGEQREVPHLCSLMSFPSAFVPVDPTAMAILLFSDGATTDNPHAHLCNFAEVIDRAIVCRERFNPPSKPFVTIRATRVRTGVPYTATQNKYERETGSTSSDVNSDTGLQAQEDYEFLCLAKSHKDGRGSLYGRISAKESYELAHRLVDTRTDQEAYGYAIDIVSTTLDWMNATTPKEQALRQMLLRSYVKNDQSTRLAFMAGIISATGTVSSAEGNRTFTVRIPITLVNEFKLLCLSLGISPSLQPTDRPDTETFTLAGGTLDTVPCEHNLDLRGRLHSDNTGLKFRAAPSTRGEAIALRVSQDNRFLSSDGVVLCGQKIQLDRRDLVPLTRVENRKPRTFTTLEWNQGYKEFKMLDQVGPTVSAQVESQQRRQSQSTPQDKGDSKRPKPPSDYVPIKETYSLLLIETLQFSITTDTDTKDLDDLLDQYTRLASGEEAKLEAEALFLPPPS